MALVLSGSALSVCLQYYEAEVAELVRLLFFSTFINLQSFRKEELEY